MEVVRQEAGAELHSITQTLTESHRNEATAPIAYVSILIENALNRRNLTENALNRLNKQSHELQQMAENDERLGARTRQMITACKNILRHQANRTRVTRTSEIKSQKRTIQIQYYYYYCYYYYC